MGQLLGLPQIAKAIQHLDGRLREIEKGGAKNEGGDLITGLTKFLETDTGKMIIKAFTGEGNETSAAQPNIQKEIMDEAIQAATERRKAQTVALNTMTELMRKGYQGYVNEKGEITIRPPKPEEG